MKNLLNFLGTLAIIAIQSIVLSALFTLCKWLLSLTGICDSPSWADFIGGAILLFAVLFLRSIWIIVVMLYRYHKDPAFKKANMTLGISWKDYKRFKNEN